MKTSTQKLRDLINNILDVAKIEEGKPLLLDKKKFSPYLLVKSVLETFSPDAQLLNIEIKNTVPENTPDILADEKQIERVISNLVSNALKFTPAGGVITIDAKHKIGDTRYEIRNTSKDVSLPSPRSNLPSDFITISVSDTGSGIPKEDIDKIFLRFYQVRGTEKRGTGLGLTICKHIVESHGGKIQVESELGKGTKFIIDIPV
jgi:signal transduction histidine kinase